MTTNKLSSISSLIELLGLPPLEPRDLPSLMKSLFGVCAFLLSSFREDLQNLLQEPDAIVPVNKFEELEVDALRAVADSFKMMAIGPLVPSVLLHGKDSADSCNYDYTEWLDSRPESSVIYVSFGSLCVLSKRQMEEIARGLIDSERPFLWPIREEKEQEKVSEYMEEMEGKGKIVRWCEQAEILSHRSLGCFVSHCRWNSSLEILAAGVPVLGVPQWGDQTTNSMLMEQVWKTGVRERVTDDGEIVGADEIRRCVEKVIRNPEKERDMRKNMARWRWREVSREAMKEGGSSNSNIRAFLDGISLVAAPHS
ncbi:UDP-glycosyltransferase 75C1-like [Prosopis cineraria]|uniref:UDP-glycosyltransferase 75C1-like n=1 Tax=Prosopis cineraria TaxID=364024 RepID=UPI00240EEF0F|nr:UDP-glycosyltransferase 75C1-like [Prosopis cineraria]